MVTILELKGEHKFKKNDCLNCPFIDVDYDLSDNIYYECCLTDIYGYMDSDDNNLFNDKIWKNHDLNECPISKIEHK